MRQSHGDRTMTVRTPYDVSMFESTGVFVLCCILFYTFEVSPQLKMSGCTRLVHECPKIHEAHTATVRSPHGLRTEAAWAPCEIREMSMHDDNTLTARSAYDLRTICLRLCTGPLLKPVEQFTGKLFFIYNC